MVVHYNYLQCFYHMFSLRKLLCVSYLFYYYFKTPSILDGDTSCTYTINSNIPLSREKNSFIHNYDDKKDVHKFYLVMSIEYLNKYLLLQGTLQVL